MSKRTQTVQGGGDRYGSNDDQQPDMAEKPVQANAAQMARRKIAQARKPSGSARSSRQGTPTAPNPFQSVSAQQSAPSFLSQVQAGSDGGFNFMGGATQNNPFAQSNGTPPPPVQFGGQNGGSAFGGNNANSSGSSFGGNNNANPAPQQNGFNPSSTSGLFSGLNNTNNASTTSFGGFGQPNNQTTQPQQNGVTPSTATTGTFPSFGKPNNENPFKNFQLSQTTPQQPQSTPGTSFGGFSSQQPNGEKAPATPSLGGFGTQQTGQKSSLFASTADTPKPSSSLFTADTPKPSTSLFSGLSQPNGTSKPDETPKANTTSLFSNLQQNNATTGLFGASTPPPDQRPTSPEGSVLSGLDSARASTIKSGMFTQNNTSEMPKSNLFSFNQQSGDGAEATPKPSNELFSAAKTNGATSNLFSGAPTGSQTPAKPTSNLFSGSFSQPPQQGSAASGLNFGQSTQSQQDTSMTTPGNTPQKPSTNLFQQSQPQQPAEEQSTAPIETPAGQGKSLFDRITPRDDPPATAQKPSFTPSASMFTGANNKENETPSSNNLFHQTLSTQQKTTFAPSTALFSQPASQASQTPSAAPWLSHAATTPAAPSTKVTSATPQPPATVTKATSASVLTLEPISEAEKGTLKVLNEGLMKHLTTQDPNVDWTTIMQYYLQQAAKIRNKPEPTFEAPVAAQTASRPPSSSGPSREKPVTGHHSTGSAQVAKPPAPPTTNNLFSSTFTSKPSPLSSSNLFAAAQTPKQSALNPLSSKPPATAPVNRKRPGPFTEEDDEEEPERGPATEKRARHDEPINYPQLPEGASNTSKLFESLINNKPADNAKSTAEQQGTSHSSIGGFKPTASTTSTSGIQPAPSNSTGFTPANAGQSTVSPTALKSGNTSSTGGFQPTTSSSTGFTPTNAGPPTVSPTALKSGNWLSAFGKKASAEEEKEKKKRKLDDYDSDEETEEEWKKRDEETQAAKRAKLMEEAQKGSGFVFNAAAAKTTGAAAKTFRMSATPSEASDNELDDDKADGEKAQGTGDNTWKPNTPLKFGASTTGKETTTPKAPPPAAFGNLFGSTPTTGGTSLFSSTPATASTNLFGSTAANGSSSLLNVPGANKPTLNFNFASNPASSVATSRATTPGVTTDGEGSTAGEGDEDDGQPNEPQVEDQTGLRPEETANEDVLITCPNTTAKKIKTKKDPDAAGGVSRGWATVGCGPLYVLKNKDTGKTRVLLKVPPYGNAKMNFPLLEKMRYEVGGKKAQLVQGAFMDHIDEPNNPRVAIYALDVGADNAPELARLLSENRPKSAEGDAEAREKED